jgi:hypothetical protein
MYVLSSMGSNLYLFIPESGVEVNLYTFQTTDFVGVTDAYVQTLATINGSDYVVECQPADPVNEIPLYLAWAHHYTIRLVCDQGTYVYGDFHALEVTTQSLIVTAGMFPPTLSYQNVTVTVLRQNATWIQANYSDAQELTDWMEVTISYKSGYVYVEAYSTNNTGNSQSVNWYSAVNTTDYRVTLTASRNGTTYTWVHGAATIQVSTNPWDALSVFGTSPFDLNQLLGVGIVLGVIGVFSYASTGAGAVLGVVTAGLLVLIGWLDIGWTILGLAFFVALVVALREGKKREREL